MDSNVMTISSLLMQTNATSLTSSNLGVSDLKNGNSPFLIKRDQEPTNLKDVRSAKADNNHEIESSGNNRFAVKKEKAEDPKRSDNSRTAQENTKPEKKESSKSNKDDNTTNQEYKITLGSLVREVARNNEPGGGRQLSQLIKNYKENGILPATAQGAKSADNKQLLSKGNTQTGIKTILSEKSAIKPDLQTGPANTSCQNSSEKNANLNQGNITLKPEVFKQKNNQSTTQIGKKQLDLLRIKKGISENEVNKTSEPLLKVADGNIEKSLSAKNKQDDQENIGTRRLKEFSVAKETLQHVKGSVNGPNDEKQNIVNAHVSSEQIKIKSHSTSDDDMGVKDADNNIHNIKTGAADQFVSTDQNHVKSNIFTKPGTSNEAPNDIGKQVLESIHSSLSRQGTDKEISVRLNPPELGKVFIKFHEQDNQITGMLEVNKTQTRSEIEQILPQIIHHLSDSGVNIKRLEVVLTNSDQTEQETLKDTSFFGNQQQHHNFSDSGLYDSDQDMSKIHEWLTNNISFENHTGLRNALTVDSSINILI